jgi:hypothetical protein
MSKGALVQALSVPASAGQPGHDGRLSVAEDPFSGGRIQPFGQCRQHNGDLLGRSFQPVQRGMAARAESGVTGLATKGLDALGLAMLAIPDQCVDVSLGDPAVGALRVGTSEPFGV